MTTLSAEEHALISCILKDVAEKYNGIETEKNGVRYRGQPVFRAGDAWGIIGSTPDMLHALSRKILEFDSVIEISVYGRNDDE